MTTHKATYLGDERFKISSCFACGNESLWVRGRLAYPAHTTMPHANKDMPASIRSDYNEAREIAQLSPRGAAALLRLAIQKLCVELGLPGDNLNNDIAELSKRGLPTEAVKALDIVRVIGNSAVHPGKIDENDIPELVDRLFVIVNLIIEKVISEPEVLRKLYEELPSEKLADIEKRNAKVTKQHETHNDPKTK